MEISIYQVLTPLISFVFILRVISKFRRDERTIRELLAQLVFWVAVSWVAVFPDFVVIWIERLTGLKSGVTGLLLLSILILFLLVIYLIQENERRVRQIAEIVRDLALKEEAGE